MRYRVQILGWTLIWSGLFIFGYLGWQLYGTDWVNAGVQAEAAGELAVVLSSAEPEPETVDTEGLLETETVEFVPEEPVAIGESFGFLTIPGIGVDRVVIYEGVDRETLQKGPGHMEVTPLPGQAGNAVISGHRTTYGRPFFDMDLLGVGDRIEVETAAGTHVYEVRSTTVVAPTDVWVIDPRPGGWLTLTTCNPKFSARERLVVFAEMIAGPNFDYIELNKARLEEPT
ncbi:MAG TPA: sortase [Acidimicrobiia bacterium]|nr:sortase [Acidimicrobiia bacterium]